MAALSWEWEHFSVGTKVRCQQQEQNLAGHRFRCGRAILWIGRRAGCFIRLIALERTSIPDVVEGLILTCKCGAVYEVDWLDRREKPRNPEERRVAPTVEPGVT
jgi:hypothetical protein